MNDHHHHHTHSHDRHHAEGELGDAQKLSKLLQHWIHHNEDHVANYLDWADKAAAMGLEETARHLRSAGDLTHAVSREFEAAAKALDGASESP
jgi:hypothetical protein